MVGIAGTGDRFRTRFHKIGGAEFLGTLFPAPEGQVSALDFTTKRMLLRVRAGGPISASDMFTDWAGRCWLAAEFDRRPTYDVWRVFEMTDLVPWVTPTSVVDTLTGLPKTNAYTTNGLIRCLIEPFDREQIDRTLLVKQDMFRVVTPAQIALNDQVDGRIVKRVNRVLGVTLAEIQ